MRLAKERQEWKNLIMPHTPLGFKGGDEGQDIRELKQLRRRPQRQLQKTTGFMNKTSHFLVHFFDVHCTTKGDVTRDDSRRRLFAQHSVALLEQCCNHSKQRCNNVATQCCAKNRRCESSRVTSS